MSEEIPINVRSRTESLAAAAYARSMARAFQYPERESEALALVVAELAGNAVRHGGGGHLVLSIGHSSWQVVVQDSGPGFTVSVLADAGRSDRLGPDGPVASGTPHASLGSGLAATRRLASQLVLGNRPEGGARVVASRSLEPIPFSAATRFHTKE